jgi:hypothetical protein
METEPARGSARVDGLQREAVLAELERILAGPAFRGAKRSRDFLRYIVGNALDGRAECLKERSIGADVFGRAADYDTGDDSIVRVKASEVRKRLAQHYREPGMEGEVQVELPPGSYAPEFRFREKPADQEATVPRRRIRLWLLAGGALMICGITSGLFMARATPAIDVFWSPVFRSGRPVLLCVAHPVVYRLSGTSRAAFDDGQAPPSVPGSEIVRDADHYVGFGDALALAHLTSFFSSKRKPAQLRIGNDVTFADLRSHPAVLIGAFTNQWTMELTSELRFSFERIQTGVVIRDRLTSRTWSHTANRDYAVVARIFHSKSGEMAITAAGLSHFGTQMAGEFVLSEAGWEQAMQQAPADWRTRNLQLVLEADVIGRTPGPPRVVASYFW